MAIPVVDVFAGPGGLNEGFSNVRDGEGGRVFETAASFEMDPIACNTLRLRAVARRVRDGTNFPEAYVRLIKGESTLKEFAEHPDIEEAWDLACKEVHDIELGEDTRQQSDEVIEDRLGVEFLKEDRPWVLIGGPPCQAYSLVGRSRRARDETFADDKKHVLYREYLHILGKYKPRVFVMENVKGILSSKHEGRLIFEQILADLRNPSEGVVYDIRSFVISRAGADLRPQDFVIRSEYYGIPQTRHRVILFGVRADSGLGAHTTLAPRLAVPTVRDAIGALPRVRSRISPTTQDNERDWSTARDVAFAYASQDGDGVTIPPLGGAFVKALRRHRDGALDGWWNDIDVDGYSLHEARSHMTTDLHRYGYLAAKAPAEGPSPTLREIAQACPALMPEHKSASASGGPFNDRFRVQPWDRPATTVVSHISKDGHYYIHPDPEQMRSLTVREAARLQTFPDSYHFFGNRTQQYHQVGNAVPPYLAIQLGEIVRDLLKEGPADPR